jgi:hypothetical protein
MMRSSLSKHVWLIQPQDPVSAVTPIDAAGGETIRFCPSWELMCLQAFILDRTGHTCTLIDVRIHESLHAALQGLGSPPDSQSEGIAVIFTTIHHLGPVGSIIDHISRQFPDLTIVLCGPFVNSFPEAIRMIPHVDFGLCGDPENILRNLLDYIDIEHRLNLVPGLIIPSQPPKQPHWVPNLQGLSLPEWYRVHWNHYQSQDSLHMLKAEVRLSRGNPDSIHDIAWSSPGEPVRIWNFPTMAQSFQKCAGQGISEIYICDPPGFWTNEHISEWCRQLRVFRNTQPWAIQMIPREIPDNILSDLAEDSCHRIEFIIPTCDASRREKFGYTISDSDFSMMLEKLTKMNIRAELIYWVHGPGEQNNESDRIYRHLTTLHYPKFAVYPFPVNHDSRLYKEVESVGGNPPSINEWIAWAQKPESNQLPSGLWKGVADLAECKKTIGAIQKKVTRNPYRQLSRVMRRLRMNSRVASLEKRLIAIFQLDHRADNGS